MMKRDIEKDLAEKAAEEAKRTPEDTTDEELPHKEPEIAEEQGFAEIKKTTSTFLVTLLIIVSFIVIVLGSLFFLSGEDEPGVQEYTYNGFTVINISGQWYTQIQMSAKGNVHNVEMRYGPMQVEDVPLEDGIIRKIKDSEEIYVTTDPDSSSRVVIAMVEIARLTGSRYDLLNIPTHGALSQPNDESLYVTCANATQEKTVIDFRLGNSTKVYSEGECIIVQGADDDEVIRAADRVGYSILGLMG